MIGNDIIDLALAQKESNWKRNGFISKIFTHKEQLVINEAIDSETMVWNLWSRKEAAYKIFNRETGTRGFFPIRLECSLDDATSGKVVIQNRIYFTKTTINKNSIYTIAVTDKKDFKKVKIITSDKEIVKYNGIPFIIDSTTNQKKPVSISHHGDYWKAIMLSD